MMDIASKLGSLGYQPLKAGVAALQVRPELFRGISFPLPEDYHSFLSLFPATGVFDRQVVFSGSERSPWAAEGCEVLEVLYAQCTDRGNDLLALRAQYADQLPEHFLVIGQVTGANFVCLDLREGSFGQVYVWDHEHTDDARKGFYLAAADFSTFLGMLHEVPPDAAKAGPKLVSKEFSSALNARVFELLKNKKD